MKEYLIKILGVFLISGAMEVMLPEGNIKKYAKIIMCIMVCSLILSPAGVLLEFDIKEEYSAAEIDDNFEEQVINEYEKRIEKHIFEKTGAEALAEVSESGDIKKITLYGDKALGYVKNELGVSDENIELREN